MRCDHANFRRAWVVLEFDATHDPNILRVYYPWLISFFGTGGVLAVGANKAGIFMHLMPVFGILMAALFLGEHLMTYHYPGIFLIFTGILLTTARNVVCFKKT